MSSYWFIAWKNPLKSPELCLVMSVHVSTYAYRLVGILGTWSGSGFMGVWNTSLVDTAHTTASHITEAGKISSYHISRVSFWQDTIDMSVQLLESKTMVRKYIRYDNMTFWDIRNNINSMRQSGTYMRQIGHHWSDYVFLSIKPLRTSFNEIWIEIQFVLLTKMHFENMK